MLVWRTIRSQFLLLKKKLFSSDLRHVFWQKTFDSRQVGQNRNLRDHWIFSKNQKFFLDLLFEFEPKFFGFLAKHKWLSKLYIKWLAMTIFVEIPLKMINLLLLPMSSVFFAFPWFQCHTYSTAYSMFVLLLEVLLSHPQQSK